MLGFWLIAVSAALITVAILGRALVTGRGATDTADYDLQVYRDQLRELDRDVARGVIGTDDAERTRIEISRRLLDADRKAQAGATAARAPAGATWSALALAGAMIVGGAVWLYTDIGVPGMADLPLKTRIASAEDLRRNLPAQAEIEADLPVWAGPPPEAPADYIELIDKLRTAVATKPDDVQGQQLLAQHEAALGNFSAAHKAMARVLALKGDTAAAEDYTQYADLLVLAAGGRISPEAAAALDQALALNPSDPVALYYSGLMFAQTDRPDVAFQIWRDLLERSDPSEPWVDPIRSQIGQLAAMAGVDYTPPALPGLAGPTADDMAAAADMSPEDRAAMVGGMVDRLMDRLAGEGGTADEWAQLINALGVMGDADRARTIWGEAQTVFAGRPDDLATIDAAAREAGLDAPAPFTPPDGGADAVPAAPPAAADDSAAETVPGPSADDIAAAAEMSPEDQAAMIDGMVTRLADELATDGGPPEKWVMLLNSLGQLGETERARAVWTEAQEYFADDPDGLARVRPAAEALGVTE